MNTRMDAGGSETSADNSLMSGPQMVFQCESCRSILGDATKWIAANEPLESFTLSEVAECVAVGDALQHSSMPHDAGSSYYLLACKLCEAELGRYYVTTPSHLDHLRNHFTLDVGMVTSYELGSSKVKSMLESKGQELPLLREVVERFMKLQHLVVTMNERLCAIEQCLQDDGENGK